MGMTPEEREARHRNAAIEKQLRTDARDFENTIKILLLGKRDTEKSAHHHSRVHWGGRKGSEGRYPVVAAYQTYFLSTES